MRAGAEYAMGSTTVGTVYVGRSTYERHVVAYCGCSMIVVVGMLVAYVVGV